MTKQTDDEQNTRILGHLRIFQSVFTDSKMRHEIVTDQNGVKRWAYVYDEADPYELGDLAFPKTVAAIRRYAQKMVLVELEDIYETCCLSLPVPNCLDTVSDRISAIEKEMEK